MKCLHLVLLSGSADMEEEGVKPSHKIAGYEGKNSVKEISLSLDWSSEPFIHRVIRHIRPLPSPIALAGGSLNSALLGQPPQIPADVNAIRLQPAPLTWQQLLAKRLFDLVVGTFALLAVFPALIAIAALIRLDSPGPILFRQRRVGLNGRPFQIFKFRTMTTLDDGPVVRQVSRSDDRVTRIGRILRRLSLDELPQLVNVLEGTMSLVGPRPHAMVHDATYSQAISSYSARHNVKPGITGWAQANGWRGATPALEMMIRRLEHDLWYIDHWSLWLDIKIMLLTIRCLRSSQNAF
jgi:exopolysaccharide biosynthesis polyprenyl glycosylphosphotransferase